MMFEVWITRPMNIEHWTSPYRVIEKPSSNIDARLIQFIAKDIKPCYDI